MNASQSLRTVVGFVLAPLAPGALISMPALFDFQYWVVGFYLQLSALLGYPVAVVFGIPLALMMHRRHWTGIWSFACAGALLGGVAYLFPHVWASISGGWTVYESMHATIASLLPPGMSCGILASITFWLITRPDRQERSSVSLS